VKKSTILSLFLSAQAFFISVLPATEQAPWLGNTYEFEPKVSYTHFYAPKIDLHHKTKHHHVRGNIEAFSLVFTPAADISTELEVSGFDTREHEFGLEKTKATVRYLWLNDVVGDPVSLTTGASFGYLPRRSFHDISLMHHGYYETELHAAVGKEFGFSEKENTYYRTYFMPLFGIAERGSPWARAEAHIEGICQDTYSMDIFVKAEKGFGNHKLRHIDHFKGYADINYRFLDTGLSFKYILQDFGSIYATGTYRLAAKYGPKEMSLIEVGLVVPFSF
jgi:hypothetical protein